MRKGGADRGQHEERHEKGEEGREARSQEGGCRGDPRGEGSRRKKSEEKVGGGGEEKCCHDDSRALLRLNVFVLFPVP